MPSSLQGSWVAVLQITFFFDDTTLAYKLLRMSTSHFVRKEMTWIPLAPLPVKLGWNHFRETETLGVWELAGLLLASRFELCVAIHTNVAQCLCDIPSNLPLCGGSERVPSVREVIHVILCKIAASHAKYGVMQSVTFVDGHCVRHVRRASRNVHNNLSRHLHGTLNVSNLVCVMRSR